MAFLFKKWLRIERPKTIALHPSRTLELDLRYVDAFDCSLAGIERVLGGTVRVADRNAGRIEATFGLMFSERLSCTVRPASETRSQVIVESRRGAQTQIAAGSDYVNRLAEFLLSAR